MNRYPTTELGYFDLLKWSFRLHYLTLKYSISCIFLITVAKYASLLVLAWFQNYYAELAVKYLFALPVIFFFSAALLATDRAFNDKAKPIVDAMRTVWHRIIPIFSTFFAYALGAYLIYFLGDHFIVWLDRLFYVHAQNMTLHGSTVILMATFVLVFVCLFFFSYPLCVIDEKSLPQSFYCSAVLTEKNKLGILFLIFLITAISLLLKPGTVHEYFLSLYHLDVVYDFVVLCVMVPLLINLLLFLIHDSKQQLSSQ